MPRTTSSSRKIASSHSLRRAAGLGLGLLSLLGASVGQAAHAGTVNWIGTSGDWFQTNPSNWDNGSTPGSGDDAVNSNAAAAITLGQSTTIQSFFSNGAFTLSGGDFAGSLANAQGTVTVNNVFTDNGGGISNFTVAQGMNGSVVFGDNGNTYIDSDVFNAAVSFANDAYMRLYNTNTFNGALNMTSTSNGIQLQDANANLVVGTNGSLNGFGNIFQVYGGTVTNNGTVNANSNGNALTLNISNTTNNSGATLEATSGGVLDLNNTTTNSGTIAAKSGGIVNIANSFASNAGSLMDGVGGTFNLNNVTVTGILTGTSGTVLNFGNNGNNNINGATLDADTALNADAYTRIYGTVTNNNALSFNSTSNGIQLQDTNANLINNGTLNGYGNIYQVYGGATLTNNGTVNANSLGDALTLNIDNTLNNSGGMLEATNGGILDLSRTTTNSGTIAAKSGGIVNIGSSSNAFTTFTSSAGSLLDGAAGTFNLDNVNIIGTVTSTTGTTLNFSNNGNNSINNGGTGTILDTDTTFTADAYSRFYGTVTNNNTIHFNSTSNGLQLQDTNTNLINNGSLVGFGNIFQVYGGTVTNNGTVNANSNGNALTLNISNTTNNSGATLEATSGGVLDLNNTTTNSGTIAAKSGGIVNIANSFASNAGSLMDGVGGTFNLNNVTVTGILTGTSGTVLNFGNNGNNNINGATLNVDTALNADAYTRIYGTVTNNNTIHFNSTSNGIQLQDTNANLINNGTLNGYGTIYQVYDGTVTNNGTINANTSGSALNLTTDFTNNSKGATLEATSGGLLNLNNNTTNSGTIKADTGSTVNIANSFVSNAGSLMDGVGGTFNLNNVTVTGILTGTSGTVLNFGNSGNNNINGATLDADTAFTADAYTRIYGTVTNNNALSLTTTTNGLQLQDTSANLINNGSLVGYGSIYQVYGGATLTNNGTVNASGGTLALSTDNFVNAGTTEVQNGAALTTAGNTALTDSGNILVKSGGTATFGQPVTQTAGLTQVDGTLNSPLTLTGGTLSGTGTINGNVTNTGGTVAAGDSPGVLTIAGSFSQGAGGTLNAQFSNTTSSVLNVMGAVTTGGILDVNYIDTMPYTGTGPFTFLDYGTLATSITSAVGTQYFSNEIFDPITGEGIIDGHNGFTYALINNTGLDALQLQVLTAGVPAAVPEASTTVSMGLLLLLGAGGLVFSAKRKKAAASA